MMRVDLGEGLKKNKTIKALSLILLVVFLSVALPAKANAEWSVMPVSPETLGYMLLAIAAVGLAFVAGPNLVPAPTSVSTGEVFVMRSYPPASPWVKFNFFSGFSSIEVKNNLLSNEYYVKAPPKRGMYDYERKIFGVPLGYKISVLSEEESRAGVINPTRKDFDREPINGAIFQSIGFVFGLGYVYADEIPIDNSWPWQGIKSIMITALASLAYSEGASMGLKNNENPGFYLGVGLISWTVWDVVRIINAKNEYAKGVRENKKDVK